MIHTPILVSDTIVFILLSLSRVIEVTGGHNLGEVKFSDMDIKAHPTDHPGEPDKFEKDWVAYM